MNFDVIGVRFKNAGKVYNFNPNRLDLKIGDGVVVGTSNGDEYAIVATNIIKLTDKEIKSPLKNVLRKATTEDEMKYQSNLEKAEDALKAARELIIKHKLDMKLVDAEFAFDGSKVVISFVSDNRVDFRDLVKDLAIRLKTRIELRQIGIRDQARTVGAIGICGLECCCSKFLNSFDKVSIKMAKNQNLSLNPTKISGMCGRLMCCLDYENDYYQQMLSKMPKVNSEVITPDGKGTVSFLDLFREKITARVESSDGVYSYKDYALADIKFKKGGNHE
ncbi:MAG: stage 0 sporulation family protein [Christensenellaceae bacterium]|jgi:cell fate regulator YaaT (PSP1 superfamily)|nr:stage 0 sporulation family protein [Christensenellaceae bacterium]